MCMRGVSERDRGRERVGAGGEKRGEKSLSLLLSASEITPSLLLNYVFSFLMSSFLFFICFSS